MPPDGVLVGGPGSAQRIASADRRFVVARSGFRRDQAGARSALRDPDAAVRAAALAALVRMGAATPRDADRAVADDDPRVRIMACELASALSGTDFSRLLSDPDDAVVEAAAFALGELGDVRAVAALSAVARTHQDPLCRESAVAALGAIGDEAGKPAVLSALDDLPAIRRRAVIALAPFEGEEVEEALRARLADRDWQVRQAAEDLLGAPDAE